MSETPRSNDVSHAGSNRIDEKFEILISRQYFRKVLSLVNAAKSNIDILMFHWGWYDKDMACEMQQLNRAIIDAQRRGIKVRAYCNMFRIVKVLRAFNIDAKLYRGTGILHAKLLLVDDRIAVFGSHNFSNNALCFNTEISVLLNDRASVEKLKAYFESLWRLGT